MAVSFRLGVRKYKVKRNKEEETVFFPPPPQQKTLRQTDLILPCGMKNTAVNSSGGVGGSVGGGVNES